MEGAVQAWRKCGDKLKEAINGVNADFKNSEVVVEIGNTVNLPNSHVAIDTTTHSIDSDMDTPAGTRMDSESVADATHNSTEGLLHSTPSSNIIDLDLNSLQPGIVGLSTIGLPFIADKMVTILGTLASKIQQLENEKCQVERERAELADNSRLQHEISQLRDSNNELKESVLQLQNEKSQLLEEQKLLQQQKAQFENNKWDREIDRMIFYQEHDSLKEKAVQLEKEKRAVQHANSQLEKRKSELKCLNSEFERNDAARNKENMRLQETTLQLEESECRLLDENSKLKEQISQLLYEKSQAVQDSTEFFEEEKAELESKLEKVVSGTNGLLYMENQPQNHRQFCNDPKCLWKAEILNRPKDLTNRVGRCSGLGSGGLMDIRES